jgi:hypothetical protein
VPPPLANLGLPSVSVRITRNGIPPSNTYYNQLFQNYIKKDSLQANLFRQRFTLHIPSKTIRASRVKATRRSLIVVGAANCYSVATSSYKALSVALSSSVMAASGFQT